MARFTRGKLAISTRLSAHRTERRGLPPARRPYGPILLAVSLSVVAGCGSMQLQKPSWNKPWGRGALIPAMICGAAGAGVGVAIQNERAGTSTVIIDGQKHTTEDNKELWKGAVVGFPAGAILCGVLGHVFLDPTPEATLAPPPPMETPTPSPTPAPVITKKRIVLRGVNFDFDSAEIRPDSRPILEQAVTLLNENRDVLVIVEGHTDAIGSEAYNQALSIRRAEAVYRYLVNHGVAPERLHVEGYGETRPVASNDTETGRAQNRRVELRVAP
jgi:outer membrane protein OmpA-like peptidoglycan-associated protein